MNTRKRVVIIGAGFAGLDAAHVLSKSDVDILLIDKHNYHTFTPLLYQVATCGLDPSAIAYPVRTIFRNLGVEFLMGTVTGIDTQEKSVVVQVNGTSRVEKYDALLLAAGSVTNFFLNGISEYAFGLKDLEDAIALRQHILKLFEKAAWETDDTLREAYTTFVVVGGGATGIETAGALYELYNDVLAHEYGHEKTGMRAKVILLEATDKLLAPYPERLRQQTVKQLESLGVEVRLNAALTTVEHDKITLKSGEVIPTKTLVWAAGVKASPLVSMLNVPLERMARVPVKPTLEVIGLENVYAAGDLVHLLNSKGQPYPMIIQVAKQQGRVAAANMIRAFAGQTGRAFKYSDLGIMATIGRRRAVAWIFNKVQLSGLIAWFAWLFLHLVTLMGFRNRASVFVNWVWNYVTYDRSVRIILNNQRDKSEVGESG